MVNFLKKVLFVFTFVSLLIAHPHTFITSRLGVEFAGEQIKGVWVHWEFDEMFSALIIAEADVNGDGEFSKEEIDYIYENAFSNLEHYGYFFYLRDGNKRKTAQSVSDFSASIKDNTLFYKFFVPLKLESKGLVLSIFDSTYFCATDYYKEKPVYFVNDSKVKAKYSLEENRDFPVYYNPLGAVDDDTVYTEWKPGLEKAYPQEVVVRF